MSLSTFLLIPRRSVSGWISIAAFIGAYAVLYLLNFTLPLNAWSYSARIWDWSQWALALTALAVLVLKRARLKPRYLLFGLALAVLAALARSLNAPGLWRSVTTFASVSACYLAGVILFEGAPNPGVHSLRSSPASIARSLLLGVAIAIPLAVVNNLYFYMNAGGPDFQNFFLSAFEALGPGVYEEIVFRFFVLALCLSALKRSASPRLAMGVALTLAVVPHSLNHLPDLFLQNPLMGFIMLAATSLLFGLPMALLQIRRDLESAIAFHWFIDFARFWFGF
jgi:hypothetical protein